jgi:hypothetical protein
MRRRSPEDSLDDLVGKSAGQICHDNPKYEDPYYRNIVNAATVMWERYLSPWIYLTQREDGTTIWRAPDESALATVDTDGTVKVVHL